MTDAAAFRLCSRLGVPRMGRALTLASAWPLLVLQVRPFSNSLEAVLLALTLIVAVDADGVVHAQSAEEPLHAEDSQVREEDRRQVTPLTEAPEVAGDRRRQVLRRKLLACCVVGAVTALGFFIRFTFVLFALPVGLYVVLDASWAPLADCGYGRARGMVARALAGAGGFLLCSSMLVFCDSIYFCSLSFTWDKLDFHLLKNLAKLKVVITPLNGIIYNSKFSNLAIHGLHPHYLHALVNLPLLFGPLAMAALKGAGAHLKMLTTITGMSLSLQEPRFLLPMLLPLAVLYGDFPMSSKKILILWVSFNSFGLVFFGFVHQGGLVPALAYMHRHLHAPELTAQWLDLQDGKDTSTCRGDSGPTLARPVHVDLIFYRTYMPPGHLLAIPSSGIIDAKSRQLSVEVLDLGDSPCGAFEHAVLSRRATSCLDSRPCDSDTWATKADFCLAAYNITILIAPATVSLGRMMALRGFTEHQPSTPDTALGNSAACACPSSCQDDVHTCAAEGQSCEHSGCLHLLHSFGPHLSTEELDVLVALAYQEGLQAMTPALKLNVYIDLCRLHGRRCYIWQREAHQSPLPGCIGLDSSLKECRSLVS
eukprot:SM000001S04459  [mRNA]  locus=s1:340581:344248:+ [translate_table: standard]